jgi:hypothetical protein
MGLLRWTFRGANHFVSASLWLADPAPRSPPRLMDGRDGTPDYRPDERRVMLRTIVYAN